MQKFHSQFVRDTLERHSLLQEELIENICSIVLQNTLARIFIKKPLDTGSFSETDYKQLRNIFENSPLEEMKEQLQIVLAGFLSRYYENSDRLQHYLAKEPENLAYRMQNAMGYDTLEQLFH